jgi:hypothetical protein
VRALSVCAALTLVSALAACGHAGKGSGQGIAATIDALPAPSDGVIARVGPYTIGTKAFKNAYVEAVEAEPAATRAAAVPPDFSSCVDRLASVAKSLNLTLPSKAKRAEKCRERYEAARDEILDRAVQDLWIVAEARRLGLTASLGPKDELIGPRLRAESGRLARLMGRNVLAQLGTLSPARLRSYYESHSQVYSIPAQRDLRIVRVATAAAASRTKREIAAGRTFASAAHGLPRQPHPGHPLIHRYEWGDFREPILNEAIFAAKLHALEGPVRVSALYGYFIFEVLREYPRHQLPFASVRQKVLSELPGKLRNERLASFTRGWAARWRAQTACAPGYVVEMCAGAQPAASPTASQLVGIFE